MKDTGISSDKAFAASQYGKEKEYWLKKLSGDLEKTIFPYDYTGTYIGNDMDHDIEHDIAQGKGTLSGPGEVKIVFPAELSRQLIKLGTGKDHRIHIILLAILTALSGKYTGSSDIIVGVPIYKQEKGGKFINTVLAVRNQLAHADHITGKGLLLQVRQALMEAVEHQNYPLDTLVYRLNLPVYENEFPLFDIILLLENIHDKAYIRHLHCNLVFSFLRTGEVIEGHVEYNPQRYKKSTMEGIVRHFTFLLGEVLDDIDRPLSTIEIVTPEEKQRLLEEFNDTDVDYPREKTLFQLFFDQVRKTPDHIAVIGNRITQTRGQATDQSSLPVSVTYRELDERTQRLACFLQLRGAGAGTITGIIVERSLEMVIGILGILKSGSAYLPVDPGYPRERINYMLEDCGARLLVTAGFPDKVLKKEPERIFIDSFEGPDLSSSQLLTFSTSHFSRLAYIIYTSGSTGKPKAVGILHRGVVNTLAWRKEAYRMGVRDVSLQLFPFCFDGFITGFFTPLISGGKLVLPGEDEVKDITVLKRIIRQNLVTHFISVPLLYRGIIENLTPAEAASLKTVTLAGDKTTPDLLELTRQKNPNLEIANEYGVTEVSVMSTLYRHQEHSDEIRIGKPIGNTKIHILDKHGNLQSIGIYGELCIAGEGLAPGYLNKPELTFERFVNYKLQITNKGACNQRLLWGGQGGGFLEKSPPGCRRQKIYKTGDLARWLLDGNIELAGRIDHQVKIRGHRIELGEIEARLLKHSSVKEATATLVGESDEPSICAYFVADREMLASELRDFLTEMLPDYVVPSYFFQLEKIPCTSTGKIDYKSLPDPKTEIKTGKTYHAPANETERDIVQIWAEVLGLASEKISTVDDFFDLGGNSISILKVQSRLSKKFQQEISMSTMFLCPTIKELAANLRKDSLESKTANIVKLNKGGGGNKKNLFIFHPLHGMVYPFKELAALLENHVNVYGIQARGLDKEVGLPGTYDEMLTEYLPQIRALQATGPYLFSGFCIGNVLAYEAARQLEDEGQQVEKLILLDIAIFIPEKAVPFYRLRKSWYNTRHSILGFLKGKKKGNPTENENEKDPTPFLQHRDLQGQSAAGVGEKGSDEQQRLKQRVEANNIEVAAKYQYKRIIRSPIVHIRAQENNSVGAAKKYWKRMSKGNVECFVSPGNHDNMLAHPHVEKLAEIIKQYI